MRTVHQPLRFWERELVETLNFGLQLPVFPLHCVVFQSRPALSAGYFLITPYAKQNQASFAPKISSQKALSSVAIGLRQKVMCVLFS